MKKKTIITTVSVFCLLYNTGNSQTVGQINSKIDSLEIVKKGIQLKINSLQKQFLETDILIERWKQKKLKSKTGSDIKTTVNYLGGILRDKPSATGKEIVKISENETIYVSRWQQNLYFKTAYKGLNGYLHYSSISSNYEIDQILLKENEKSMEIFHSENEKLDRLTKIFGKNIAYKLMNEQLWVGMSQGMVIESIGKPISKKRTSTNVSVLDLWTYQNKELHFENGVLKSWDNK